MRRLIPLAIPLVLVVLTATACTAKESGDFVEPAPAPAAGDSSTAASAAPSTTTKKGAAAGDKALAGNTQAICDQSAKVTAQFGKTFADDVKMLVDAASKNDAAVREIEQKTTRDVQNYSFALKNLGGLVADPGVKKALTEMSKEVTALKSDVKELDAKKLADLSEKVDTACGRG